MALLEAREVINDVESLCPFWVVDRADIEQQITVELGAVPERSQNLDETASVGCDFGEPVSRGHDIEILAPGEESGQRVCCHDVTL